MLQNDVFIGEINDFRAVSSILVSRYSEIIPKRDFTRGNQRFLSSMGHFWLRRGTRSSKTVRQLTNSDSQIVPKRCFQRENHRFSSSFEAPRLQMLGNHVRTRFLIGPSTISEQFGAFPAPRSRESRISEANFWKQIPE